MENAKICRTRNKHAPWIHQEKISSFADTQTPEKTITDHYNKATVDRSTEMTREGKLTKHKSVYKALVATGRKQLQALHK